MRRASVLAVVLAVAAASCGRCTRDHAAAPERHLPAVREAIVVPDVATAQKQLRAALDTASRFPAASGVPEWLAALRSQLGFDPLTEEGLESAGIDADGGAAWADTAEGPLLVLPVADAAAFDAALVRLARDRLGATERTESTRGQAHVVVISRGGAGAPAELAFAIAGRVALLARGPGSPDAVARAATLDAKDTLAAAPAWKAARDALGRGYALIAYRAPAAAAAATVAPAVPAARVGPGTAPAAQPRPDAQAQGILEALWRDGAAVGLSATAERVSGRGVLLLGPERQRAWREIIGSPSKSGGDDLARLPKDAFVVARFGGDPVPLGRRALWAAPEAAHALAEAGFDVERDGLAALAPGAAVAISLAPTFDVTAVSRRARDAALNDPFRSFHLAGFARVSSREKARAAMDALVTAAQRSGVTASAHAEPPTWTLSPGGATLEVALGEDRLFFAGGPGRVEELQRLARAGDGWSPPTSGVRGLATGGAGAVVVDFGNLVRSAQALPASAYGTGPDAFVMRSIADRILDPASRLEVAGVRVELADGAVRADFELEAREGAEPRP